MPEAPGDPLIGTQIAGRYRIDHIHARGGMSVVYAATYEAQQREVAIKVIDEASSADPQAIERFEHEARTASSVSHGNVVGVSDFGRLEDGRPYLVMPMILGQDLATLVAEEGPMSATRVAVLLSGVASALDAMHAQGLVHRDIKSENIMFVRGDDGTENALVLDFGIAVAPSASRSYDEDSASGTPDFMAPEVIAGEPWDHRADVYSLATVAFELLTGRLPFQGRDLSELLRNRASEPPRTLSEATRLSFHPTLEEALGRGLARDAKKRTSSAGAFVRELSAAAAHARSPLSAPPPNGDRAARLRTLVGLPFQAAANAEPPPPPEPRIVVGPSLPAAPREPITDSLRPLSELDADLEYTLPPAPWRRFGLPIAVALAAIALVLWTRSSDAPSPVASTPERVESTASRPRATPLVLANLPTATPVAPPIAEPAPPPVAAPERVREARRERTVRKRTRVAEPPRVKGNARALTQEAVDAMLRGDFSSALANFEAASDASPHYAPALRGKGLLLERMGRSKDAASAFRQYLRVAPDAADAEKIRARLAALE